MSYIPGSVNPNARLIGATDVVTVAIATGLSAGFLEVLAYAFQRFVLGTLVFAGYDLIWMAPLGTVLVFAAPAALLALLAAVRGREAWLWPAYALFGFLGALSALMTLRQLHPLASFVLAAGVATQLARGARRADAWRRGTRRAALALAALTLVAGLSVDLCRHAAERRAISRSPAAPAGAPNVLLLILDTVRGDALGLSGYARNTTPRIDAFARRGVVFDAAIAPSSWTLPSHASMFTGFRPGQLSAGWIRPLDAREPTVAEVLRDHGWRTAGFAANFVYAGELSGLQRGFSWYSSFIRTPTQVAWSATLAQIPLLRSLWTNRDSPRKALAALRRFKVRPNSQQERDHMPADELVRQFLRWQAGTGQAPFFAFLNFFDAHDREEPIGAPYDTMFGAGNDGRVRYDRMLARIDHAVGTALDTLAARGVLDRTVVIITSDHGEHFGEHGIDRHGNSLYLPLLRVPLIIVYGPSVPAARRVAGTASLQHLAATVLELAGVRGPMTGPSLSAWWRGAPPDSLAFSEVEGGSWWAAPEPARLGPMRSVVGASSHYIVNGDSTEELYDLANDAGELHNLARDPAWQAERDRLRGVALGMRSRYRKETR